MSSFLIDRNAGTIIVNGVAIPFSKFVDDKSQVGRSAYEEWLLLPGNAGKSVYQFIEFLKGTSGTNGTDAYVITIDTDKGNIFKNSDLLETITLTCVVTKGANILSNSSLNAFAFVWRKDGLECLLNDLNQVIGVYNGGTVPYGATLSRNVTNASKAKYIIIGPEDVNNKANFTCDVMER